MPTQEDIENNIKKMKPKNNNMVNGINLKVLKWTVKVLAHLMAKIMSNSIEAGIFPSNLWDAEVVLLFKNGYPSNYRSSHFCHFLVKSMKNS